MAIIYKTYAEIDQQRWDTCINESINGLIYAQSFYLNVMSPGWHALVLNDYEAVMPLTIGKKMGIPYLYQAPFVPQGGIFSAASLTPEQVEAFLTVALEHFKFIEVALNYHNTLPAGDSTYEVQHRSNYVLDLNKYYPDIYNAYASSTRKNLNRCRKFELEYRPGKDPRTIVSLYHAAYGERMQPYINKDFERLATLFDQLQQKNKLLTREVYRDDTLLAAAVFPFDGKRIYNLASYVSGEGREKEANYWLFDNLIKEFSQQPLLLDFEGSDVKGIAGFYQQFTATNETYPFIKINRLPFPVKQLKSMKDWLS